MTELGTGQVSGAGARLREAFDLDRNNRLMALANMLWGAGTGVYLPIWPLHLERLGAEPAIVGLLLGMSSALSILVSIPAASMATRLGWKRTLVVGWGLGPVGTLLYAMADRWQGVIPGIICMALVSLCGPAYLAYIGGAAGGRNLPRVFGVMGASITVGTVLTSPIGGVVADGFGMRWVLVLSTVFYTASFMCVWWLDDLDDGERSGPAGSDASVPEVSGEGLPVAVIGAQTGYLALLRERTLWRPVVGLLAMIAAAQVGVVLAPAWLADAHGYTRSHIGVLGSLDALGAITLNMVLGHVASRRGTTMALVLGAGLTVLGHVALLEASWWPVGAMAYLLRSGAGTFHWIGTGAVGAILRGLPGSSNGRTERGFALYYMAEGAVLAISTMLAGLIYGWWSPGPFIVSMASLSLLVAIALVARSGWWTGRYPSGRERPSEMARIGDIR